MPRVSSAAKDALQGGFGLQEGIIRVVDDCFKIVQRVKADGTTGVQFFANSLSYIVLDADLQPIDETEVHTKDLTISWPARETGEYRFSPGNAQGPDDEDPQPLGTEPGTEGNSLYSANEGDALFSDSDWMHFIVSLEKQGFKPAINAQSYAPNYVGLECSVKSVPGDRKDDKGNPYTHWVVEKIHKYPYEGGAKKGARASAGAKKKKGAGAKQTNAGDVSALFLSAVATIMSENAGESMDRDQFQQALQQQLKADGCTMPQVLKVVNQTKKDDWLTEQAGELGFAFEDGAVTFAEA